MCPEDVPTSWADVPFSSQVREMQSLLDQGWGSPASVGTSFGGHGLPFATAANTNVSMPTPISLPDSTFLEPRPSPSHSLHSRDPPYAGITEPTIQQGLGISVSSDLSYIQPGTLDFEHAHRPVLNASFNAPGQIEGFRETIQQPSRTSSRHGQTRSTPVRIAPNPAGARQLEANAGAAQDGEATRRRLERRRRGRNRRSSQRDEEDRFVSELREQNVPWRDVAERVNTTFGGNNNPSCLQMRMTRRRRRMQEWSEDDIQALRKALGYWEKAKFEIVSQKMQEFGALEKWTASQCEEKWRELESGIPQTESNTDHPDAPPARRPRRR